VWDVRLSELAAQIVAGRQNLVKQLNQGLATTYSDLVKAKTDIKVNYSAAGDPAGYASTLLRRLEHDRPLDLLRGYTAAGPHREDLIFTMNGSPLAVTASRGENRTLLLALKILELGLLESRLDTKPLLLLDDVFSELDGARRRALTLLMHDHQTFITTTDADIIAKDFAQHTRVLSTN
jgi:DNA replication and repair protein RecF